MPVDKRDSLVKMLKSSNRALMARYVGPWKPMWFCAVDPPPPLVDVDDSSSDGEMLTSDEEMEPQTVSLFIS